MKGKFSLLYLSSKNLHALVLALWKLLQQFLFKRDLEGSTTIHNLTLTFALEEGREERKERGREGEREAGRDRQRDHVSMEWGLCRGIWFWRGYISGIEEGLSLTLMWGLGVIRPLIRHHIDRQYSFVEIIALES